MSAVKEQPKIREEILELSKPQGVILAARKPRILNMAGQGGGKSASIGFLSGLFIKAFPKVKGFIAANTYLQLSQSTLPQVTKFWEKYFNYRLYDAKSGKGDYVMDKQPPPGFKRYHQFKSYNNIISFRNGHTIFVGSLDNYLAHDGKEFAYAHLDETKDTKEVALKTVILARIRQAGIYHNPLDPDPITNLKYFEPGEQPEGWVPFNPCYIHTSPAEGTVEWLVNMFGLAEQEKEILPRIQSETDFYHWEDERRCVVIYSTFHNSRNLPEGYITGRLAELTEGQALKFVYGYPFSKTGGEFYTQFNRLHHLTPTPFIPGLPIHISIDFNVMPYMTLQGWQIQETETEIQVRLFQEWCLASPQNSTQAVCEAFLMDYQDEILDLFYYGDASGKNRIAGKGDTTNFDDLESVLEYYISSASDRVGRFNKPVLKRREFIERLLAGKVWLDGKRVVIMMDPSCKETAKDFQYLKLGRDGKLKELAYTPEGVAYQKLGHCTDAAEYFICEAFADIMLLKG